MPESEPTGGTAALVGVLAGVLVLLVVVLLVLRSGEGESRSPREPSGLAATEPADPTVPAVPNPVEAAPDPTDREPTEADAAAFTATYDPPGGQEMEAVTVDLDGDGRPEVVVASVAGDVVRLDVAVWGTTSYEVVHTDQAGPAEALLEFTVRDVTGDGVREIVTLQAGPDRRQSLALWGWRDGGLVRLDARGGCWDGSHVYGHVGADIIAKEIVATCPPDDETPPGSEDVYTWDGQAWTYDRTE